MSPRNQATLASSIKLDVINAMVWDALVSGWHELIVFQDSEGFIVVDLRKFGVDGLAP